MNCENKPKGAENGNTLTHTSHQAERLNPVDTVFLEEPLDSVM